MSMCVLVWGHDALKFQVHVTPHCPPTRIHNFQLSDNSVVLLAGKVVAPLNNRWLSNWESMPVWFWGGGHGEEEGPVVSFVVVSLLALSIVTVLYHCLVCMGTSLCMGTSVCYILVYV